MLEPVLREFDLLPESVESLGNAGGFSGSAIWKITAGGRSYCLRRWPHQFDRDKLNWIHKVLCFSKANNCPEVVCPLPTRTGSTIVHSSNASWELAQWADGMADFPANPNQLKLNSAIEFLARFHNATARYHFNFAPSKNVATIVERLSEFSSTVAAVERNRETREIDVGLSEEELQNFKRSGCHLAMSLRSELARFQPIPLPVQPVIRDIRAEHLFFENDKVSGIIDFGAMQVDSVACDLSRMSGSLSGDDKTQLLSTIEKYSSLRALTEVEQELVLLMNKASVPVGILNWLDWIFVQRREFESVDEVKMRLRQLLDRMNSLC